MPKPCFKLTHKDAKLIMDQATKAARFHNVPGAIAIVDAGGDLILLESLDDTMSGASKIAIGKAATAVAFKRPTMEIEKVVLEGRTPMLVLEGSTSETYVPLKGGYPIRFKGELLGAIAVAGTMDANMDEVVVLEALENMRLVTE
ncbi:heme-binding protein [uncultured Croceitalea sp.]|uniref:GlcG/HbpS family heme-binding protein n=1 Tax=uncultured Croceitalea sp. TaxID=1798908 RepID=UPI0033062D30